MFSNLSEKQTFYSSLGQFSNSYFYSSMGVKAVSTFFAFTPSFSGFNNSLSLLRFNFSSPTPTVVDFSFSMNFISSFLSNFKFFYGLSQIRTFFSLFRAFHLGSRRPYFVKFFMKGVGYRVWPLRGKAFYFRLGFTHRIVFYLPPHVTFRRRKYKFVLLSFDFARLSQVAKHLLSLRVPDVYKGKGIRYAGDRVFTKSRLKDAKKRLFVLGFLYIFYFFSLVSRLACVSISIFLSIFHFVSRILGWKGVLLFLFCLLCLLDFF